MFFQSRNKWKSLWGPAASTSHFFVLGTHLFSLIFLLFNLCVLRSIGLINLALKDLNRFSQSGQEPTEGIFDLK